jgi:hypothetical protein
VQAGCVVVVQAGCVVVVQAGCVVVVQAGWENGSQGPRGPWHKV